MVKLHLACEIVILLSILFYSEGLFLIILFSQIHLSLNSSYIIIIIFEIVSFFT